MTLAFSAQNLSYAYQDAPALNGLSIEIEAGQRVALLGANGSGKSTLLKLMDALYFAHAGTLSAFGDPLREDRFGDEEIALAFRRRVGLVFQNPDVQLFNPTVFDEIAFGPLQLGWSPEKTREMVEKTCEAFRIDALRDRPPHRLSGGEKKRVALASVLITSPDVLLLDEPTAALDPQSASEVIDTLVRLRHTGRTVVTATHDLDIVEDIADICFVLHQGRIIASGTPSEILYDVDLLKSAHLVHAHLHGHGDDAVHSHHHLHRERQDREGESHATHHDHHR